MEDTVVRDVTVEETEVRAYLLYLREQERSQATIRKYSHDLLAFRAFGQGQPLSKALVISWKEQLVQTHAPAAVNSMLAAVNGFLRFRGLGELCVKPLKIQRALFLEERRELKRGEYQRLVEAAGRKENQRLALVMQTICATGIRVSELRFITVEALQTGRAEIRNKGKWRVVFLPGKLRRVLQKYAKRQKKTAGAVFTTRTGKPLDRSNIWRDMKKLCQSAEVDPQKVFPHNLRHLFARTFYAAQKDLGRLADILGHSSINTTRIYTAESGAVHAAQIEQLELVVTT